MNGVPIAGMKAHKIVERGIALVPEGRGIFGELTVAENLAARRVPDRARAKERANAASMIYSLFPRLAERKSQIARTMSGGEQQMVAIGRALMSQPEILMLDEPSLGLSPVLTKELFRSLAKIAETGVGILLVEQNARQSLKIAQPRLSDRGRPHHRGGHGAKPDDRSGGGQCLSRRRATRRATDRSGCRRRFRCRPISHRSGVWSGASRQRAGAIQQAFVRALRQAASLPSAFVGRYDPKKAGDPWAELAAASRLVQCRKAAVGRRRRQAACRSSGRSSEGGDARVTRGTSGRCARRAITRPLLPACTIRRPR